MIAIAALMMACSSANPLYSNDDGAWDGPMPTTTSAGTEDGAGHSSASGDTSNPAADGTGDATASYDGGVASGDDEGTTGSTSGTSGVASSSTGLVDSSDDGPTDEGPAAGPGLGESCGPGDECDPMFGAQCCTAAQCLGYCMVPCDSEDECPMPGMGCHHGYCLFPCDDGDEKGDRCEGLPGFTCQHGEQYCESDVPESL